MTDTTHKPSSWEAVGKLATVVTILGGLLVIWVWYSAPSASLVASVEYGAYRSVPETKTPADTTSAVGKRLAAAGGLVTRPGEPLHDAEVAARAAVAAAEEAANAAVAAVDANLKVSGEGYIRALVTNEGDLPVKDVTLRMPDGRQSLITREDGTTQVVRAKPTMNLGELKPNESVEVYSWHYAPVSRYTVEDEIAVHHAGGKGSVRLESSPEMPEALLAPPFIFFTLPAFLLLLHIAFALGKATAAPTKPTGESTDAG